MKTPKLRLRFGRDLQELREAHSEPSQTSKMANV